MKHCTTLYQLFCEEIVLLIERIRFLYLENLGDLSHIEHVPDWGEINDSTQKLHQYFKQHIDRTATSENTKWSQKVKALKDNILRKEMAEGGFYPVI